MTVEQNDLTMRPIAGREELDLFSRLPYVLNEELEDDLAASRRRPEWMWVALRGDHLLARVAWWGRWDEEYFPTVLFVAPDERRARQLLRIAHSGPEGSRPLFKASTMAGFIAACLGTGDDVDVAEG